MSLAKDRITSLEQDSFPDAVQKALKLLGIERFVVAIHDQCFPSCGSEEIGRGSPYSQGAERFIRFVRGLGFNGVQFGPQGKTSPFNLSPYDGTLFSRNEQAVSLYALAENEQWHGLLSRELLAELVAQCRERQSDAVRPNGEQQADAEQRGIFDATNAQQAITTALQSAFKNFVEKKSKFEMLWREFNRWTNQQQIIAGDWLGRDALFDALSLEYGTDDWRSWSDLDRRLYAHSPEEEKACSLRIGELRTKYAEHIQFYEFCQFIIHQQHNQLRKTATGLGIQLYGDLQIGFSARDKWSRAALFMPGYLMGAPPSRTNPEGQPWGYPILDPRLYVQGDERMEGTKTKVLSAVQPEKDCQPGAHGPALAFFIERARKMINEFDGIRIDHPHGLVDPWVYKADEPDSLLAVKNGARLFSSPDVPSHPELAPLAIASPEQITGDPKTARYADDWVVDLTDAQVKQYGLLVQCILSELPKSKGSEMPDIVCEVLSTCPYPLKRVLDKYSLGRFRVTQKADLVNTKDGYRSENAEAADLIMVGNHDTKPLYLVIDDWFNAGQHEKRAAYLAERLEPEPANRQAFAAYLAKDRSHLAQAMFADLFVSPAHNISIFFPDLFGMKEVYNQPGTINSSNWALRVPANYESLYNERAASGEALSICTALRMALRARYPNPSPEVAEVVASLDAGCIKSLSEGLLT
jgi:4-alpha-glucanotransferase